VQSCVKNKPSAMQPVHVAGALQATIPDGTQSASLAATFQTF